MPTLPKRSPWTTLAFDTAALAGSAPWFALAVSGAYPLVAAPHAYFFLGEQLAGFRLSALRRLCSG
jgi:hypothetical protein